PLSAAIMGPAAMNGPRPGMASIPTPASQPKPPHNAPPTRPPAVAPSGALVWCSWAKSFVPVLSGSSAEISLLEKSAVLSWVTISEAWASLLEMQKTDFFAISSQFCFQHVRDAINARNSSHTSLEFLALMISRHGAAQSDT